MSLLFCFVLATVVRLSIQCQDGWRQSAIDSNKCYRVVVDRKIWFEAEIYCQAAAPNAHLTSVASAYETFNINAITADTLSISLCDTLWIGGNDFEQNGRFAWTDGMPFMYTNWGSGQPDQSNRCIASQARSTGVWKTEDCGTEKCFICESYSSPSSSSTFSITTTTPASSQLPIQNSTVAAITSTRAPTTITVTQQTSTSTSPPPASCDLKKKKLDLIFVLDASVYMGSDSFETVKTFVKVMLNAYNISQSATQFGLMTLAATANGQFSLSASNNMPYGVPGLIDPVPFDGSNGQNMIAALNMLLQVYASTAQGYRTDPDTQHLIIYITSNSAFTGGDPFELATTIRRSGTWGIAALAYGVLVGGTNNLIQLSGNGCFYSVGNPTDLNINGLNFLQTLTCFGGNICQS